MILGAGLIYGCSGCYDRPVEIKGVGSVYGEVIIKGRDEYGSYGGRYRGFARAVNIYKQNQNQLEIGVFRYEGCREKVLRIMLEPENISNLNIRNGTLEDQNLLEIFKISFKNQDSSKSTSLAELKKLVGQLKEIEVGIVKIKYRVIGYNMEVNVENDQVTLSHITPPVSELVKYDPDYIYLSKAPIVVVEQINMFQQGF